MSRLLSAMHKIHGWYSRTHASVLLTGNVASPVPLRMAKPERFGEYKLGAITMFSRISSKQFLFLAILLSALGAVSTSIAHAQKTLLNVSYDPTRELYKEFNAAFGKYWQARPARRYLSNNRMADRADKPVR